VVAVALYLLERKAPEVQVAAVQQMLQPVIVALPTQVGAQVAGEVMAVQAVQASSSSSI
jgi:hypothetical protein